MAAQQTSVYEETAFPLSPNQTLDGALRSNPLWVSFAGGEASYPDFEHTPQGALSWRRFLLWKTNGVYKMVSYKKGEHLLMDICTSGLSSTLLVTFEQKDGQYILRLDHRSFVGTKASFYIRFFTTYWKKMFRRFEHSKNN